MLAHEQCVNLKDKNHAPYDPFNKCGDGHKTQKLTNTAILDYFICSRIIASVGVPGPLGPASRSAPTLEGVPGGFVAPGAPNPPWEALDGDITTHVRATDAYGGQPWWMMTWPCLETISAVDLTSSLDGDAGKHKRIRSQRLFFISDEKGLARLAFCNKFYENRWIGFINHVYFSMSDHRGRHFVNLVT